MAECEPYLLEILKKGHFFYKHDYGRNKRGRKWLQLSNDGLSLRWKAVGKEDTVEQHRGTASGGSSARGLTKSLSFNRFSTISLSDVSHIIYGPYTETFAKKTMHDRVDERWMCFSLVLRESRTVDLAVEEESVLLPWLLGLQQLIVFFSPERDGGPDARWTLSKLHLQKLRLKVSGESDRTGQGPYDVVLSAVLAVANENRKNTDKATVLQAAWRRRNVQGKFQTAVQEMMELNGLIEDIEEREKELQKQQDETAIKIEQKMADAGDDDPPPKMPSEQDMKDPKKMQEYMLQMGEYSARQQLKLTQIEDEVRENQQVTSEVNKLATEKRQLQNMQSKLQFAISTSELKTLSEADMKALESIQKQLGVTPRGTIHASDVRQVRLYKETQQTRLGIIFHQNTPAELGDVSSDLTPRVAGQQPLVIPIIKHLDPAGVAGSCTELSQGDQVLSVNGKAALSNIQAVQMLREAVGELVLAVRTTKISTPRSGGTTAASPYSSGLRPINRP